MIRKISLFFVFLLFTTFVFAEAPKWNEEKSTHFIVYYKNTDKDFINKLVSYAEDYYNSIAGNLGLTRFDFWLWENRAKIYVYDNARDYHDSTSSPQWAAGWTYIGQKTIETYPGASGFFGTVLPHEMGHIILREYLGLNNPAVPLWLDEGVAMYQQREKEVDTKGILIQAMHKGSFLDLTQLTRADPRFTNYNQAGIFYVESLSIVSYLIREFGSDRFQLFLQNLRDKHDLERAVASSYNFASLKELDSAWEAYIKK